MSLPDTPRAGILPPARALAATAVELTRKLAWHTLHPRNRERFLVHGRPVPLTRLDYTAGDGWTAPLYRLDAAPGGAGEPVVLAHGLGLNADAYRAGEHSLAGQLSRAGFTVYLFAHRGDRAARGRGRTDFDAIVEGDVPAALERVLEDSGAQRAHWVGHHLGGQLGLVAAGRGEPLATLAALGAPVEFDTSAPQWRRLRMASRLVPGGWMLPADRLARLALPFVGDETLFGDASGAAARELVEYGSERVSAGLLRQVLEWMESGSLSSRGGLVDYTANFSQASVPLLVAYAGRAEDNAAVTAPLQRWRHPDALALCLPGTDVDLALGTGLEPLVGWLCERRALAWPLAVDASTAYAG